MAQRKYRGVSITTSPEYIKEDKRSYDEYWASNDAIFLTDGTFIDEGYNPYDDNWEKSYRPGPYRAGYDISYDYD